MRRVLVCIWGISGSPWSCAVRRKAYLDSPIVDDCAFYTERRGVYKLSLGYAVVWCGCAFGDGSLLLNVC